MNCLIDEVFMVDEVSLIDEVSMVDEVSYGRIMAVLTHMSIVRCKISRGSTFKKSFINT